MEIIYKDKKYIIGVEVKFKWGHIYQMINNQVFLDTALEDIPVYVNIMNDDIMKVSICPEVFPFAEVIDWILP